jgi:hypothetical protein
MKRPVGLLQLPERFLVHADSETQDRQLAKSGRNVPPMSDAVVECSSAGQRESLEK